MNNLIFGIIIIVPIIFYIIYRKSNWRVKTYLNYRINTFWKDIKRPMFWVPIVAITFPIVMWKTSSTRNRFIIFIVYLFLLGFLLELARYQVGEWKRWWRDKVGIISKKRIKELKGGKIKKMAQETEQEEKKEEESEAKETDEESSEEESEEEE